MSLEEQIRTIANDELQTQIDDIEKRMRSSFRKENNEIKEQIQALGTQLEDLNTLITGINLRSEKLEKNIPKRFGLITKLRKHTLDQLMSEYKRLTGTLRPDQDESPKNAEI
jgi:uncharacterized protein involved in exopolysaccharide biosynthesis